MSAVALVERTKVCARCQVRKPWSEFQARTRWEDGSTRTVIAYCRPCASAKRRECYDRNPGSKAAACRRYRERLRNDPDRLADYREKQRFYMRTYMLRRGRNVGQYTRNEPCPAVDAQPFVTWLRTLGSTATEIGLACGMSKAHVEVYLRGRGPTVRLDTVDRACLHAGIRVDDLYPLEDAA